MPEDFWLSLKRSLNCKPNPSEVHDPNSSTHRSSQRNSNSKDFIQGRSKNHSEKPRSCSPITSQRTNDILNPITHEIVLDSSNNGGFRICRCCPCPLSDRGGKEVDGPQRSRRPTIASSSSRKTHHADCNECNLFSSNPKVLVQTGSSSSNDPAILICHKCGEKLKCVDAVEAHHVSQHSVIELNEEDSSRQIIETICRTSWPNSETKSGQIESVLKVQNMPRTFASFEEYREMVKLNAEKFQKKQPRCLADGNELLRFHGTTITCSLGVNGSSALCTSEQCGVCQILRHGSFTHKDFHGSLGVLITSTCGKAFESIGLGLSESDMGASQRKSVIVCRVIAGRGLEEVGNSRVDSLAEKTSSNLDDEELYVLNPRAILPCFVVIYKPVNDSTKA